LGTLVRSLKKEFACSGIAFWCRPRTQTVAWNSARYYRGVCRFVRGFQSESNFLWQL